ncbi:hypothetical protein [Actinacidiphila oryziradicis]|uniref:hypothetical protein n=1 Tax=Actinacidiphila oryziradicis TaxID=2571141 RepID=UPI00145D6120|nr:hypothetical protein [Actinacidiphila oryziradicis]
MARDALVLSNLGQGVGSHPALAYESSYGYPALARRHARRQQDSEDQGRQQRP